MVVVVVVLFAAAGVDGDDGVAYPKAVVMLRGVLDMSYRGIVFCGVVRVCCGGECSFSGDAKSEIKRRGEGVVQVLDHLFIVDGLVEGGRWRRCEVGRGRGRVSAESAEFFWLSEGEYRAFFL